MDKKETAALVAFLGGFFCFVVLVTVGRLTGNAAAAWTVVSLICFAVAMGICWDHPGNFWFTGLLLNLTVWLLMYLVAEAAQFREHLGSLTLLLVCGYLGAAVGWGYPHFKKKRSLQ